MNQRRFQILSLDGGGIRGSFSAAILAAIEEDLDVVVADHFDLIVGTSTGGIIALALGLGLSPREVLAFYLKEGREVFADPSRLRSLRHWLRAKHPATKLEAALRRVFGDQSFGDSKRRLVIPSFNIGRRDVYLFRTPHLEKLRRDFRVAAWKVAMATAAAPTFLPVVRDVDGLRLTDGGVWANNPTLVGVAEAVGQLGQPLEAVAVLNIGTMSALRTYPRRLDRGGKLTWASYAPSLILDATSLGVQKQCALILGDRYLRVDALAPEAEVTLDDAKTVADVVAAARHESRTAMPRIAPYMQHTTADYVPIHSRHE